METVIIRWNDGSPELEAEVNGNVYIVDEEPTFPSDLSNITIVSGGNEIVIANGKIVECASVDGRYWFGIQEVTEEEAIQATMRAQIDYIAMMSDIDLEEVL